METGHWESKLELPEKFYGFVYCITNLLNNKRYIGKKQAWTIKKLKPLKGKTRKRHVEKETDWKTYTGSSPELNEDIKNIGKDKFKFEIIKICDSKWALAYYEAKAQFENDVLFQPENFYNGIINLRIGRAPKDELRIFLENKEG